MCEGIVEELQGIDLGDKRLNKRSVRLIETLSANAEASINASCEGWSDTLAAYRFFDNDAVTPEQILRPHREATQRRMREHPVVLIVQDTTELDYTQHPPKEDRCTPQRDREAGPAAYHKVRDEVRRSKLRTTRTIELCQTPKRAARQADVEIRAIAVQVKPPHARGHLPSVTYNVVLVEEVGGPGDDTDLCWLLITTLPIETVDDVLRIIDYYLARWTVEIYFRTLKTGCRVEEIQLETIDRLQRCLAFYRIIAWRILYLTYLNRTCPKLPCTAVFEECEWKSVWRVVTKKPLPKKPPLLSKFMQLLTQLGGYNNRATEPAPGPQSLWIGLRRMTDFATAWLAFGPENRKVVYK